MLFHIPSKLLSSANGNDSPILFYLSPLQDGNETKRIKAGSLGECMNLFQQRRHAPRRAVSPGQHRLFSKQAMARDTWERRDGTGGYLRIPSKVLLANCARKKNVGLHNISLHEASQRPFSEVGRSVRSGWPILSATP